MEWSAAEMGVTINVAIDKNAPVAETLLHLSREFVTIGLSF
jgi:hypothetical protein